MKKFLLLLILIPNLIFSQKISLDNSITSIYTKSYNTQINFSLNGNNSYTLKKFKLESITNYQNSFSQKLTSNELLERLNISHNIKKVDAFVTYQFGYSLVRKVKSNNLFGLGLVVFKKVKDSTYNISISYATLYKRSLNFNDSLSQNLIHSIRLKYRYRSKNYSITTEYFYQPSFKSFNDYSIFGNTKLTIPLKKWIGFTIQDNLNYNPRSSTSLIHTITFGIQIDYQK
jgi:hypothetical protein